jgi:hypothetical protein
MCGFCWFLLHVYVIVVRGWLIDQADKRVPLMLRLAFPRELPTCIQSTYCSPVVTAPGVGNVPITRCSRALSDATQWSYVYISFECRSKTAVICMNRIYRCLFVRDTDCVFFVRWELSPFFCWVYNSPVCCGHDLRFFCSASSTPDE